MTAPSKPATRITLPSDCEIAMTREFDAPRHLVFDAWTKPELLKKWFGPSGWTLAECDVDLKVGGKWRHVLRKASGTQIALSGIYQEIVSPERLVNTQLMEGCEGQGEAEALCTMVLSEQAGKTKMTSTVRYPSKDVRDSVLQHGTTEEGMDLVFDKLAKLLGETV